MKLILMLFLITLVPSVFAGEKGGNGGDAVVCRNLDGSIRSAELLDFYEGRVMRDIRPEILDDKLNFEENLERLFSTLAIRSSSRADLYRSWYARYPLEVVKLRNTELTDIPDSNHLAFPKGCKVEQVMIQQIPRLPGDKRFTLNLEIWEAMPTSSQAGLIMHELIYRELIDNLGPVSIRGDSPFSWSTQMPSVDSVETRYFNTVVASGKIKSFSLKELNDMTIGFQYFKFIEVPGIQGLVPFKDDQVLIYSQDHNDITALSFGLWDIYPPTSVDGIRSVKFWGNEILIDESLKEKISVKFEDKKLEIYTYSEKVYYGRSGNKHRVSSTRFAPSVLMDWIKITSDKVNINTPPGKFEIKNSLDLSNVDECSEYDLPRRSEFQLQGSRLEMLNVEHEYNNDLFTACGVPYETGVYHFQNGFPDLPRFKDMSNLNASEYFRTRRLLATDKTRATVFDRNGKVNVLPGSEILYSANDVSFQVSEDFLLCRIGPKDGLCKPRTCVRRRPGDRVILGLDLINNWKICRLEVSP